MSREGIIQAKEWERGTPKGIYWVYYWLHLIFVCMPVFVLVYSSIQIFFFFHSVYSKLTKNLTLLPEKLKKLCHRCF